MTPDAKKKFDKLRNRLTEIDSELIELIAERQRTVHGIGEIKHAEGKPLRDFNREKIVVSAVLARAEKLGLDPGLAEEVIQTLIRYSLTDQERDRVAYEGVGSGKTALVIGGGGRMGQWFVELLSTQGHGVTIADPSIDDAPNHFRDWRDAGTDFDVIVVAAPLVRSNEILLELADTKPRGLVFDIGSLKTPLRRGLERMHQAGCRIASLHPMFGPNTRLLTDRHLIFIDAGCPEAVQQAKDLFEGTMVERIDMSLDDHDKVIAYVLGLSHALNISFFTALANSGEVAEKLARASSSTFDAQLQIAAGVARENPHLYFEIQSLNEYGNEALAELCKATSTVQRLVEQSDEAGFVALMQKGRAYFDMRRDSRQGTASAQSTGRRPGDD